MDALSHSLRLGMFSVVALSLTPSAVMALETVREPATSTILQAPWIDLPPYLYQNSNGERAGFIHELTTEIASETGFTISFTDFQSIAQLTDAIKTGATPLFAGTLLVPAFGDQLEISPPVAKSFTALFVRTGSLQTDTPETLRDRKIGYVESIRQTGTTAILERNEAVAYSSWIGLVAGLIAGEVDAALGLREHLVYWANEMGVSSRIAVLGGPLAVRNRHVIVHESQSHLMPTINDALTQLETRGTLRRLRQKYFLEEFEPIPDVLSVGVMHFPPYQIVYEDGNFGGFAIEAVVELAARAALTLELQSIDRSLFLKGPGPDTYDLLPQYGISPERLARMDFSYPIDRSDRVALFVRTKDIGTIATLADLQGQRVGVRFGSIEQNMLDKQHAVELINYDNAVTQLEALTNGDIKAAIMSSHFALDVAARQKMLSQIAEVSPPLAQLPRAIALRPGLVPVRDSINAVMPGYLISPEYRSTVNRWFGEPAFWTRLRIMMALLAVGVFVVICIVIYLYQRQRHFAQIMLHNKQVESINTKLLRSNRDLDNFAYIASHDLTEPLRGVTINANFLLRDELTDNPRKRVNRMIELSLRMERLISDLLQFSRLGQRSSSEQVTDINKVLKTCVSIIEELRDPGSAHLEIVSELPKGAVDPARIQTVMQNLIINALQYNESTPKTVEIGFSPSTVVDNKVLTDVFFVRDNGIGIDPAYSERVFDIFSRLNPQKMYNSGTGAGLSFVKRIIEGYDGQILLSSSTGNGTTFYFNLPVVR